MQIKKFSVISIVVLSFVISCIIVFSSNNVSKFFATVKINDQQEELFYLAKQSSSSNIFNSILGDTFSDDSLYDMKDRRFALVEARERMESRYFFENYVHKNYLEIKNLHKKESFISNFFKKEKNNNNIDSISLSDNYIDFWETTNLRVNKNNYIELRSNSISKDIAFKKLVLLIDSYNSFISDEMKKEYLESKKSIENLTNQSNLTSSKDFLNNISIYNSKSMLISSAIGDDYLKFVIFPEHQNWEDGGNFYNLLFNFCVLMAIFLLIYNINAAIRDI